MSTAKWRKAYYSPFKMLGIDHHHFGTTTKNPKEKTKKCPICNKPMGNIILYGLYYCHTCKDELGRGIEFGIVEDGKHLYRLERSLYNY